MDEKKIMEYSIGLYSMEHFWTILDHFWSTPSGSRFVTLASFLFGVLGGVLLDYFWTTSSTPPESRFDDCSLVFIIT